ncbi:phosphorylase [Nitrosomonas aestuarii]|uniref:phosphorylase family protein n=1 Tax=Nitrosomonas aestuarii TaxID=52441 RepID=UPI000D2FA722|nr:phosphorylase [Nitrosomonas aestuarii]PTN12006.1 hopanoid-associated phosphorylase [Nitrosomonas aestuarii]
MSDSIVGIVSALKSEASCLMKLRFPLFKIARIAPTTRLCLSGMGNEGALKASEILHEYEVDALLSFGVAAALDNKLVPGDLVVPESIYYNGRQLPVTLEWRERVLKLLPSYLTVVGGTLTGSRAPLFSRREKLELGEETGACAADMETAIVADFAAQKDIPFIAIRAIVDPLEFSPPPALLDVVYADGTTDIVRLIPLLFNGSVPLKTLFHLGMGMYAARSTLTKVVEKVGLDFKSELTDRNHVYAQTENKESASERTDNNK